QEIAGVQELGMTGRGEFSQIGTFLSQSVDSELSGNVIDLCPVGALTSKPFRFSARSWELSCRDGVAAHDSVGSNIIFHVQHDQIKRVVPRNNEAINESWISDRDRFSYTGLTHSDRLLSPKIKQDGQWTYTDWPTALRFVADKLKTIAKNKADRIGSLVSPNASVEEMYLTQKLMRSLGSSNIDFRLRQGDFSHQDSHPKVPGLATSLEELEKADAVLLLGSNVRKDQPLIGHRIRKAVEQGARVYVQNPVDFDFNFTVTDKVIVSPEACLVQLSALLSAIISGNKKRTPKGLRPLLKGVEHTEQHTRWVEDLKSAKQGVILLGNLAVGHPAFGSLMQLANVLAGLTGCTLSVLPEAANSVGGWVAGCLPHRGVLGSDVTTSGYHAQAMLNQPMDAYVLCQVEVEADCWDGHAALKAMYGAECVTCLTAYETPLMRDYADVLLPVATAYETSGSRINAQGDWQSFNAVVPAPGEARPSWKVLRVLANLMDLDDFDYQNTTEIHDELYQMVGEVSVSNAMEWACPDSLSSLLGNGEGVPCVSPISLYSTDALVRRAPDLQQTRDARSMDPMVRAHPNTLNALGLQGENIEVLVGMDQDSQTLSVCADEGVAENCVMIPINHQHPGHLS
ncbi:MAG TPA: NADH-quinone oxidoreductase subunit G, partial [Flavobacteriales bacterium]|nr:NADH-quinone oxidoreductase subunit G [Flavobacteriales bacterium]